jgi:MFS family permease
MGIGRFAFTPLLPLMMATPDQQGLTLAQGGWLATANYVGYLLGAMTAARLPARHEIAIIRGSLLAIAAATAAMAWLDDFTAWMGLRALAGVASAWVMVHVSAWALRELALRHRPELGSRLYGGVGAGIAVTGLLVLLLTSLHLGAAAGWALCGLLAALLLASAWGGLQAGLAATAGSTHHDSPARREVPHGLRMVLCYGAYGLGYIIPATFLPALARQYFPGTTAFGWVWPCFGLAALASTVIAARLQGHVTPRRLWVASHVIMTVGVAALLAGDSVVAIVISAGCIGGAFILPTVAGFQLARQYSQGQATRLIGAMTAAFAFGQIIGPLLLGWAADRGQTSLAIACASLSLAVSAWVLGRMPEPSH